MNGVGGTGADLFFQCSICSRDDGYYGQLGGRSLVQTSCNPKPHVFHLECITQWFDNEQKTVRRLDERQCAECHQKALPLIRMDRMRPLNDESPYCETRIFNACRTGNTANLKMLLSQDRTLANRAYHSVTTGHPEHLLAVALKNEHTDAVRLLIDYQADVNAVEHNGETILHIAARMRRTEDFQMLVRAGADINNVLSTAVRKGDALLLGYLISTKPSQPALNNALREAAEQGQTRCLEILIRAGANALDRALYIAVLSGDIEARRILEQHGANIITVIHTAAREGSLEFFNLQLNWSHINETNEEGQTPLHITAANGHSGCLERLLEINREKVNARSNSGETALHLAACNGHGKCLSPLIENGANLNATNNNGETALHLAAGKGHKAIINVLLEIKPSLAKEKDNAGSTAFDLACCKGHKESAEALRAADGNKAPLDRTDTDKAGVLSDSNRSRCLQDFHDAADNGNIKLIRKLLNSDSSLAKEKDINGWTALHFAAFRGYKDIIKELLKIEPSLTREKNEFGHTALDLARLIGHEEIAKVLRAAGGNRAAVARTDTDKVRVLSDSDRSRRIRDFHFAANSGKTRLIREWLYLDSSLAEEKDENGWTALHFAASRGHTDIIIALLEIKPSLTKEKDEIGNTALDLAILFGHTECKELFVEGNGAQPSVEDNGPNHRAAFNNEQ
ncbi:ankyrin repeat domain-containing protein [Endozoicomonas acroporae]|uniref:ankyrin repeat domain-containing protein n=1 Tax=Endozoicomonas acroporae TaxID=1701104 RepID=UPI000C78C6C7|nr:ankyrin repeat domain-containing protein [Endozoicomonas acroporae]